MVVKLATLAQTLFTSIFPCFEKGGIPTFFTQKAVTLGAIFEEKMERFEDDIL